jgi:hypothetical protein
MRVIRVIYRLTADLVVLASYVEMRARPAKNQ